jgi:hypothetical protein
MACPTGLGNHPAETNSGDVRDIGQQLPRQPSLRWRGSAPSRAPRVGCEPGDDDFGMVFFGQRFYRIVVNLFGFSGRPYN